MTGTNPTDGDGTTGDDPTGGTTGAPAMVNYVADIQPIWDANCVTGCHKSDGSANYTGVFLDPANSYATMVNIMSPSVPSLMIVKPGDTTGSYLWHKLNNTFMEVGGTGQKMPFGATLPESELELVKLWIEGGALP